MAANKSWRSTDYFSIQMKAAGQRQSVSEPRGFTLLRLSSICSAGFSTDSSHLDTSVTSRPNTGGTLSPGPKHTHTQAERDVFLTEYSSSLVINRIKVSFFFFNPCLNVTFNFEIFIQVFPNIFAPPHCKMSHVHHSHFTSLNPFKENKIWKSHPVSSYMKKIYTCINHPLPGLLI